MKETTNKIEIKTERKINNTTKKIRASISDIIDFEKIIRPYLQKKGVEIKHKEMMNV